MFDFSAPDKRRLINTIFVSKQIVNELNSNYIRKYLHLQKTLWITNIYGHTVPLEYKTNRVKLQAYSGSSACPPSSSRLLVPPTQLILFGRF